MVAAFRGGHFLDRSFKRASGGDLERWHAGAVQGDGCGHIESGDDVAHCGAAAARLLDQVSFGPTGLTHLSFAPLSRRPAAFTSCGDSFDMLLQPL